VYLSWRGVCMYICTHVHMYVRTCVCTYICMHACSCACAAFCAFCARWGVLRALGRTGLPQLSHPAGPGSRTGRASSPARGSRPEGAPRRGEVACSGARGAGSCFKYDGSCFDYGGILDPLALGPPPPPIEPPALVGVSQLVLLGHITH